MPRHRVGAKAPPDDRLRRGIQYSGLSRSHLATRNTGSSAFADDDGRFWRRL